MVGGYVIRETWKQGNDKRLNRYKTSDKKTLAKGWRLLDQVVAIIQKKLNSEVKILSYHFDG